MESFHNIIMGSAPDADIRIDNPSVKRYHARISEDLDGGWSLEDLAFDATTTVNGRPIGKTPLFEGDLIGIGDVIVRWPVDILQLNTRSAKFIADGSLTTIATHVPIVDESAHQEIWIGSSEKSDLRVDDPGVEELHARIYFDDNCWVLEDLAFHESTFRNGKSIGRSQLQDGDILTFGNASFRWPFTSLDTDRQSQMPVVVSTPVPQLHGPLTFKNVSLVNYSANEPISPVQLEGLNLVFEPGTLNAIIGPSGIGKSTLFRGILNRAAILSGSISFLDIQVSRTNRIPSRWISLVPQATDLPVKLTVREFLRYVSKVRNAKSLSGIERDRRIDDILSALDLEDKVSASIQSLSGGQLKRVSIAAELLNFPKILLLDEPSSGLDEGLDRQLLYLLRSLARDRSMIVVVITHTITNITLTDSVVLLGRNPARTSPLPSISSLRYFGDSVNLLDSFEIDNYSDLFDIVRPNIDAKVRMVEQAKSTRVSKKALLKAQPSVFDFVHRRWLERRISPPRGSGQPIKGTNYVIKHIGAWLVFVRRKLAQYMLLAFCVGLLVVVGDGYGGQNGVGGSNPSILRLLQIQLTIIGFFAMRRPLVPITDAWEFLSRERLWGLAPANSIYSLTLVDLPWLFTFVPASVLVTSYVETLYGFSAPSLDRMCWLVLVATIYGLACYFLGALISVLCIKRDLALELTILTMVTFTVFSGNVFRLEDQSLWSALAEFTPSRQFMAVAASVLNVSKLTNTPPEFIDPTFVSSDPEVFVRTALLGAIAAVTFVVTAASIPHSLERFEKGGRQ